MNRTVQFLLEAEQLYALEEKRILVTAVFHGRRDPHRWSDRVRDGHRADAGSGTSSDTPFVRITSR